MTLTFFDPSAGSQCRSLYGGSVEEAAAALRVNHRPYRSGSLDPLTGPPSAPATQSATSLPISPISLSSSVSSSDGWTPVGAPPSIPHASASSPGAPLDLWSDSVETYAQSARRARNVIRRQTAPSQRWYAITRGSEVGVVQGTYVVSLFPPAITPCTYTYQ